ncbi:MAG: hypothetical protein JNL60_10190 [Bacteroidia bacterium]|nr:hypothetical protein [Bacteroidia bacterium]
MKIVVWILWLAALGFSCETGFGSAEGTVVNEQTLQPVANVKVQLRRSHNANTDFPIQEKFTDENGHFKFKYYHNNRKLTGYRFDIAVLPMGGSHILYKRVETGIIFRVRQ